MEALMTAIDNKKTDRSKILIVEDHEGIRSSLKQWLRTVFQDYVIRDVSTGEDAVELCKEIKPDVVVMDIKLPGINGILATKQIKKMFPDTKVIMLTIYDIPAFQAEATAAGASAFISKNNMYKELIPAIQRLIA
ncbi:MAG: response regulator transcription factor [Thermodesulfovibrionales bacterium]